MSLKEVNELTMEEFLKMSDAVDIIKANDILSLFKVTSFPNMSKSDRESIHRHYHKIANPNIWEDKNRKLTLKDIAMALGGSNGR